MTSFRNVSHLWSVRVREHGSQPFLTYYDGAAGERTELSYATFDNWASKAANLLVEELGAGRGALVALDAVGHWAAAVTAVACWKAGGVVVPGAVPDDAAAVLAGEDRAEGLAAAGANVIAVGAGFGGRLIRDDLPVIAFADEVLAFADDYDDPQVALDDPAVRTPQRTYRQADLLSAGDGADTGARLVVRTELSDPAALVVGLAGSTARGGSIVWCRNLDDDAVAGRAADERATHRLDPSGVVAL